MDSASTNPSGDIVISEKVQSAIAVFRQAASYEKELATDSIMIGHMIDFMMKQVLVYLLEGKADEDIVRYIENAQQSFRTYRRGHHASRDAENPVRVFRRERPKQQP